MLLIGASKDRPASMDLLLLQSHHSASNLHPPFSSCQLTSILTGHERVECYPEDEGLYERVGVLRAPPPAPLLTSVQSQTITESKQQAEDNGMESRGQNKTGQAKVMAEYASVKKVRKLERGKKQDEAEEENSSMLSSSTVYRKTGKNVEPFHIPNIPKVNTQIQSAKSHKIMGLCLGMSPDFGAF